MYQPHPLRDNAKPRLLQLDHTYKMAAVIVPLESELTVEETAVCPVDGCQRSFKSSSCLNMHIRRHHEGKEILPSVANGNQRTKIYRCPIAGCNRGIDGAGKPFPRLGQLKQHYNTVHKRKQFECDKCGRGFGLRDVYKRHLKECGESFKCSHCDVTFKSKNALYQHTKRLKNTTTTTTTKSSSSIPTPVIIIKPIVRIPKNVTQSHVACQTDEDEGTNLCGLDLAIQTDLSYLEDLFTSSDAITHQGIQTNPVLSCEFGTQTNRLGEMWPDTVLSMGDTGSSSHDFQLDDIFNSTTDFTSEDYQQFNEFGTQVINFGTQTLPDFNSTLIDKGSQT